MRKKYSKPPERTVTPLNIAPQLRLNLKPTLISIPKTSGIFAQASKRIFPLNCKERSNQSQIHSSSRLHSRSTEKVPEFMSDYMLYPNQEKIQPKRELREFEISKESAVISPPRSRSVKPPIEKAYQPLQKESKRYLYKPEVVHFSARSKMTLYSQVPEEKKQDFNFKKPKSYRNIRKKPVEVKEGLGNEKEAYKVVLKPARSFGEKLIRLKELLIDPILEEQPNLKEIFNEIKSVELFVLDFEDRK